MDERLYRLLRRVEGDPEDLVSREAFLSACDRSDRFSEEKFSKEIPVEFLERCSRNEVKIKLAFKDLGLPQNVLLPSIIASAERSRINTQRRPNLEGIRGLYGGFVPRLQEGEWTVRFDSFIMHGFRLFNDCKIQALVRASKEIYYFNRMFRRSNIGSLFFASVSGRMKRTEIGNLPYEVWIDSIDILNEVVDQQGRNVIHHANRRQRRNQQQPRLQDGAREFRVLRERSTSIPRLRGRSPRGHIAGRRPSPRSQARSRRRR